MVRVKATGYSAKLTSTECRDGYCLVLGGSNGVCIYGKPGEILTLTMVIATVG